jgi:hypothetical protein
MNCASSTTNCKGSRECATGEVWALESVSCRVVSVSYAHAVADADKNHDWGLKDGRVYRGTADWVRVLELELELEQTGWGLVRCWTRCGGMSGRVRDDWQARKHRARGEHGEGGDW